MINQVRINLVVWNTFFCKYASTTMLREHSHIHRQIEIILNKLTKLFLYLTRLIRCNNFSKINKSVKMYVPLLIFVRNSLQKTLDHKNKFFYFYSIENCFLVCLLCFRTTVHFASSIQYDTVQTMAAVYIPQCIFFSKRLEQSRNMHSSFRLCSNVLDLFY